MGLSDVPAALPPALHVDNVAASPGSTFAGLSALLFGLSNGVGAQGLPTTTAGWVTFGLASLGGLLGIFGR